MEKPLGTPIGWFKKFIIGGLGLLIVVALVAGPLAIFSSLNPVAVENKVIGSTLMFNIEVGTSGRQGAINRFTVYRNNYMVQLLDINDHMFYNYSLDSDLNTRNFDRSMFQAVEMNEYSDTVWDMSPPNQQQLYNIMNEALNDLNNTNLYIYLNMQYTFDRPLPEGINGEQQSIERDIMQESYDVKKETITKLRDSVNPNLSCEESQQSFRLKEFYSPIVRLTRNLLPNSINLSHLKPDVIVRKK